MRRAGGVWAGLLACVAIACSTAAAPVDTAADKAAIDALREREIRGLSSGMADSMMPNYTDDVVVLLPNEPQVSGKEAFRTWAQKLAEQFTIAGRYTASEVEIHGDVAIERYTGVLTITPKAGGAPSEDHFKGIHVYKKQPDGSWLIAQDIWNSDAAPPAAGH